MTVTQTYTGKYEDCLSKRPDIGSKVAGFGANVLVERTRVKRVGGGRGILVVISGYDRPDNESGTNQTHQPSLEVDWVRYDKPVASHPMFDSLTAAQKKEIIDAAQTTGSLAPGYGEVGEKLFDKVAAGQESYMLFAPVVRRLTASTMRLSTSTAGKIDTPPISVGSFEYVKTADNSRREGRRWVRMEEWTGADKWDEDFYGPGS